MIKIFYSVIIFLFISTSNVSGQKKTKQNSTEKNIRELTQIWLDNHETACRPVEYLPFTSVDSLSPDFIADTSEIQYSVAEKEIQAEILKHGIGLRLSGNFTQNLQPTNDEWEVSGSYRRKYQIGVDWNMLNDGYFQHKYRIEAYKKEIELLRMKYRNSFSYMQSGDLKTKIANSFIAAQIEALTLNRNILMRMMAPAKLLELTKDFQRDEYLKLMARRDEVNSQLQVLNSQTSSVSRENIESAELPKLLPVCDLNYEVLEGAFYRKYQDSIDYSERIFSISKSKTIHEISVRPFLRYNLYESGAEYDTRHFFSTGFSFSFPIPFNADRKKELTKIQVKKNEIANDQLLASRKAHFDKLIFLYQDQLIRYLDNVRDLEELFEQYRIQRASLKTDSLMFNPFAGLKNLDDIYRLKTHMLLIHKELYDLAVSIYRMTAFTRFSDIFKPLDLENYRGSKDELDLTVYTWSSSYRNYSLSFVEEYLISNNVKTAAISIGFEKKISQQATSSIIRMSKLGIETQLLIGDNKLLDKNIFNYLQQKVPDNIKKIILGIHLDVEPQTFDDWTTKKMFYMEKYIKMLQDARQYCDSNRYTLSVSIPLSFPDEFIPQIFSLCDNVYLMAYENTDLDFIQRKSAEEFSAGKDKIVLAYRFKDFKTKIDLYDQIEESRNLFGINRFALHDFSSMTAADKALLKNQK